MEGFIQLKKQRAGVFAATIKRLLTYFQKSVSLVAWLLMRHFYFFFFFAGIPQGRGLVRTLYTDLQAGKKHLFMQRQRTLIWYHDSGVQILRHPRLASRLIGHLLVSFIVDQSKFLVCCDFLPRVNALLHCCLKTTFLLANQREKFCHV